MHGIAPFDICLETTDWVYFYALSLLGSEKVGNIDKLFQYFDIKGDSKAPYSF